MSKMTATESVESTAKVTSFLDVFDLFFMVGYVGVSYIFSALVHEKLRLPFFVFSFFMAGFLTMKSTFNRKRRNYESIYFLIISDRSTYRPYIDKGENDEIKEK